MAPEKQIKLFRKLIARDETLADRIRQIGTFDELAVLMAKFGCMIKASELAEHAETLILLKIQQFLGQDLFVERELSRILSNRTSVQHHLHNT